MLIALLLLAQVACDWVEISQHHYPKPVRPTRNYPPPTTLAKFEVERTTRANRIYINNSLPEYNWNKGAVFKVPSVEKQVQLESGIVVNAEQIIFGDKSAEAQIKRKYGYKHEDINVPNNVLVKTGQIVTNEEFIRGTDQRFSNTIDVQRVQVSSTEIPTNFFEDAYKKRPIEVLNLSNLEYATEQDIYSTFELDDNIYIGKNKYFTQHISANIPIEGPKPKNNLFAVSNRHVNKERTKQIQESVDAVTDKDKSKNNAIKRNNINKMATIPSTSNTQIASMGETRYEQFTTTKNLNSVSAHKQLFNNGARSKGTLQRHPNVGQIERVQLAPKPSTNKNKSISKNKNFEVIVSTNVPNYISVTEKSHADYEVNSVDSDSKLKREYFSTTEKSATRHIKLDKNGINSYEPHKRVSVPNPEDVMMEEILKESEELLTKNIRIDPATDTLNRVPVSSTQSSYEYPPHVTPARKESLTKLNVKPSSAPNIYRNDNIANFKQVLQITSTERIPNPTTEKASPTTNAIIDDIDDDDDSAIIEKELSLSAERDPIRLSQESKSRFVSKEENNEHTSKNNFVVSTINDDIKTNRNIIHSETKPVLGADTSGHESQFSDAANSKPTRNKQNTTNNYKIENEVKPDENKVNNTEANTIENLVKFLKVVTNIISKNTKRSFKGKLRYLEDLRDTILANIEERIESAFPDDVEASAGAGARRRRSRATQASPRGHVAFPSSESALMTISFLTFAVFLIKLVLQVLQIYKNKTMMVPTVVASVGRAVVGEYRSEP